MRKSVFSGFFYPAEKNELENLIKSYFLSIPSFKQKSKAIIAPHAGYKYCGKQLAESYNALRNTQFDTAIIIGPSHRHYFKGYSIYDGNGYQTPLGTIAIEKNSVNTLKKRNKQVQYIKKAHEEEHSIEVQLPFLYEINPLVRIIPIITGDNKLDSLERLAKDLFELIDIKKTVIIISTDFSHFFSSKEAVKMDSKAVELIINQDIEMFYKKQQTKEIQLCGFDATYILLRMAKFMKLNKVEHFSYTHSGKITGDENSVVGYNSICVYE